MSLYVSYSPTTTVDSAAKLIWEDEVRSYTARPAYVYSYSDENGYQSISAPAVTENYTCYGLKHKYPTLAAFKDYYGCIVENNVVMRPDLTSTVINKFNITGTGGTKFVTSKEVEGFNITISVPGLYRVDKSTGYVETSVSIGIFYRVYNPNNPTDTTTEWTPIVPYYVIAGKQRAEILKTIKHSLQGTPLPLAKYEILVVRHTEDHTGNMDYADDVYVKEITEILYHSLAYNHTALLGIKIRATDQLSGQLPTVTALVKGIKVAVPSNLVEAYKTRYDTGGNYNKAAIDQAYDTIWNGQLGTEKVWTDNPVWCLYDLLTNERYGLADYYKISSEKRGLMLANFYIMAKYCDEAISYIDDSTAVSTTKWRPRFAINIVLDQSKTASEWISQFAAIMRGVVFYSEGIFWIDIDRPKPMTQLFNMSNIKDYTQTSTSYKAIPNSYEVQWINPLTNYEIDAFKLDSKELQTDYTIEERKKALMLVGVTNMDQAKSVAKFALLAGQYRTKFVTFKTGTDGLRSSVTDIIGIQHDVPQWGFGGEVVSYNSSDKKLTLSGTMTPEREANYAIKIAHGVDNIQTYTIAQFETEDETSVITLSSTPATPPAPGEKYIIGATTNTVAQFKINAIKRDNDEFCEITAVEYDPTMFDYCDSNADLGTYNITDYSLLPNPYRASVQGVFASNKYYQSTVGAWASGVEVFYEAPKNTFWKAAQVHLCLVGSNNYWSGEVNSSGYFFIPDVAAGEYQIIVTSVYTSGKQTISDALSDYAQHPWTTLTVDSCAPNTSFMEGVTGLCIENMANDGTFYGKDCIVVWNKPSVIDTSTVAGSETNGAATATTDSWFAYYLVEARGVSYLIDDGLGNTYYEMGGDVRRTTKVLSERYVYTHENNYMDSAKTDGDADRRFFITVTAVDKMGRQSATKSILCYNPAPTKIEADL